MMRGAEPMTVAELKRHIDRRFLTKRGFRRELKRELTRFATKDDLQSFATKDDLSELNRRMLALHAQTMDEMRRGFTEMRLGFSEMRRDFMQIVDEHEHRITDLETMHRL
jgi:hypothetical protein